MGVKFVRLFAGTECLISQSISWHPLDECSYTSLPGLQIADTALLWIYTAYRCKTLACSNGVGQGRQPKWCKRQWSGTDTVRFHIPPVTLNGLCKSNQWISQVVYAVWTTVWFGSGLHSAYFVDWAICVCSGYHASLGRWTRNIDYHVFVSFDIKFIRRDQKQHRNGEACRASPTCFWSSLINLISKDT